jgi:hypothetical protein
MKSSPLLVLLPVILAGSAQAQFSSAHRAVRTAQPPIANPPPAPLVGGSDSCATPDVITGTGSFNFDTLTATTGTEGQTTVNCIQFNMIGIPNDVWFTWTAPQTGHLKVSSCGSGVDTKMAVYLGTACPVSGTTAVACNDDATPSIATSMLFFDVTAGQQFLIQLGISPAPPPAAPGTGAFTIEYLGDVCAYDDGTTEDSIGLTAGGELGWMHRMGSIGTTTTVTDILTAWGTPGGASIPAGQTATVHIWDDPNDDGNPNDAVLLASKSTTVMNPGTDLLQTVTLATPITVSGVFFIGAVTANVPNQFAVPLDKNGCGYRPGVAWLVGAPNGTINVTTLTANPIPPATLDSILINNIAQSSVCLLQATCGGPPPPFGTVFCPGDGSGTACPCGNNSAVGSNSGCVSSLSVGGHLGGTGNPSIATDTVVLQGSSMPNSSALYFQGTTQLSGGLGVVFGDGLRCAGGSVIRLGTLVNAGGMSQYPTGAQQPVSVKGAITAPGTRTYQTWYRNAAPFCTPSTFNLTNGLSVTWVP